MYEGMIKKLDNTARDTTRELLHILRFASDNIPSMEAKREINERTHLLLLKNAEIYGEALSALQVEKGRCNK